MPDIAMCWMQTFPSRETCYRFTATPGAYQFYAGFLPDESGKCEWYINNNGKSNDSTMQQKKLSSS